MSLFFSTTINKIDKKGRISVPAPFRASLTKQEIVLFPSPKHQCLEGFDVSFMEEMSGRIDNFDMFSDEQDDLAMSIFGDSSLLGLDDTGRFLMPKDMLSFARLTDNACFVGMGKKFQIWNPEALDVRRRNARDSVKSNKMTVPKDVLGGNQ